MPDANHNASPDSTCHAASSTPHSAPAAERLSAAGLPLQKRWLSIIAVIWAGQAVSMITSYAAGYAVVWYVTETTESALMLSIMTACVMLPIGLISPFGGLVADRHNRKLIMIVADGAVGLVSLAAALLIMAGEVSLPLLLSICLARAVGQAFHGPAMMATMPMLVPDEHLLRINTLDQLLNSVASIGAPAFGILLYTTLGFPSVMLLDFAGACAAILGLALAKVPTVVDPAVEGQRALANLLDGWREIGKTRGLGLLMAVVTLAMVIFGPLSAVFPLITYSHFGGDGYMASIAEAAFGIGMVVGSAALMAWGGGKRLAALIAVACVVTGAVTAIIGLLPPSAFPVFVGLVATMAVACAWYNGPIMTLIQRHVPDEKMGRAMGLLTAMMGIATPVGVVLGGILAEAVGIAPFFVMDGLACLALGLVAYLPPSIRKLDRP
ncbi:MFS transporter [Parvibacter caecicola]|uniref:MFS transporter n=2 Tax=Parvibacter caecicola TaxID=747645 RepID=A0A3N0ACP5_9ACTN|nr:MFS transporter [Parvibacter caecicola]MCR2041322.1 MFS transporter [Parvibacter caecicola]RNL11912.1 MFS transporter [Parvibacter caecicola]TJW12078.1 MFS transporter [Parvibacter caecicola]